jgi:hypothetical protein
MQLKIICLTSIIKSYNIRWKGYVVGMGKQDVNATFLVETSSVVGRPSRRRKDIIKINLRHADD